MYGVDIPEEEIRHPMDLFLKSQALAFQCAETFGGDISDAVKLLTHFQGNVDAQFEVGEPTVAYDILATAALINAHEKGLGEPNF